jgi:hypothetical protein
MWQLKITLSDVSGHWKVQNDKDIHREHILSFSPPRLLFDGSKSHFVSAWNIYFWRVIWRWCNTDNNENRSLLDNIHAQLFEVVNIWCSATLKKNFLKTWRGTEQSMKLYNQNKNLSSSHLNRLLRAIYFLYSEPHRGCCGRFDENGPYKDQNLTGLTWTYKAKRRTNNFLHGTKLF